MSDDFNIGWQPRDTDSEKIRELRRARGIKFGGIVCVVLGLLALIGGGVLAILLPFGIAMLIHAKFLEYKFKE